MSTENNGLFAEKYSRAFFSEIMNSPTLADPERIRMLEQAVCGFANAETVENASAVYRTFRDVYRLSANTDILGLINLMKTYEERSHQMVDSQRDHYVHSVNVFVLGLSVYAQSEKYREYFNTTRSESVFTNIDEEFLYVWGLAAMFHDIGYPVEIAFNQIRRFLRQVCGRQESDICPIPAFRDFSDLTHIAVNDDIHVDTLDIMASRLTDTLGMDYDAVRDVLQSYEKNMAESCRVDHGFFSAVMLIKWMSKSVRESGSRNDAIRRHIAESATAILLHNFYNHTFTRAPFSLPGMKASDDPISYLLILCDELQEWNRTVYGAENSSKVYPNRCRMVIEDDAVTVIYRTASKAMSKDFPSEKKKLFSRLLDLDMLFPNGFDIICTCDRSSELFLDGVAGMDGELPDFFADRILEVAKEVHANYNRHRIEEDPSKAPEYGGWETLSDDLRLSNIKQAYAYVDKLSSIGCVMSQMPFGDAEEVVELTPGEVERLSYQEHDRWVEERRASGWVYGEKKDSANRISPYIAPWDAIPEYIREYDREAVRDMIPNLNAVGIRVYRLG